MQPASFHPDEQIFNPPPGREEDIEKLAVLPVTYSNGDTALE